MSRAKNSLGKLLVHTVNLPPLVLSHELRAQEFETEIVDAVDRPTRKPSLETQETVICRVPKSIRLTRELHPTVANRSRLEYEKLR